MKNTVIILSIICTCLLVACEREGVSLGTVVQPPYSDTGANVLSCYINGKLSVFKDESARIRSHTVNLYYPSSLYTQDTFLTIGANRITDTNESYIQLNARHLKDTGMYLMDRYANGSSFAMYSLRNNPEFEIMYVTFKGSTAKMHVMKLDTINKIVAGTFSASLRIYQYGPEIINITNGRFDFKYDEYK